MLRPILAFSMLGTLTLFSAPPTYDEFEEPPVPRMVFMQEIDYVWTGHGVGFELLTAAPYQYVLYYDVDRQASIAQRKMGSTEWNYAKIDTFVEWDSHNTLEMAVDDDGFLHVSGNMHVVPLIYFRSANPHDITAFEPLSMTGKEEDRVTYPRFMRNKEGDLIFTYRNGMSGDGLNYYNIYDEETQTWTRLLDTPLIDGQGLMNAYPLGPNLGPDGYFHVSWVWRDTIMAETNHSLSYARSPDLVNWETVDGSAVDLPMTIETEGLIVDPIPPKAGIINGSGRVGFDSEDRPVVTYHKYDENGNNQLYHARWENGEWVFYQTTDWDYRWNFGGGGSIVFDIRHGSVSPGDEGELIVPVQHKKYPNGKYVLSEEDFSLIRIDTATDQERAFARKFYQIDSNFPDMRRMKANDTGESPEEGYRYELKWEAMNSFRDRARPKPWPAPEPLWLYKIKTEK